MDDVISRAKAGDPAAFQELFRSHRDTVARVVHRTIGPTPDIEDIVQDVFIHVHRSLKSFRGDAKFTTWLYRLTVNVSRMHIRRKRSRPKLVHTDKPVKEDKLEAGLTPDEDAERGERIRALYRLLDQLSEKKREVLVMHDIDGVPAKEIAEIVGAPVLTVRTRLFYARKELYAALAAEPSLAAVAEQMTKTVGKKAQKTAAVAEGAS